MHAILLESGRAPTRRGPAVLVLSVTLHSLAIAGAVVATAWPARARPIEDRVTRTVYVAPRRTPPPAPPAPTSRSAPRPEHPPLPAPPRLPVLPVPDILPTKIPDIAPDREHTPDDVIFGRQVSIAGGDPRAATDQASLTSGTGAPFNARVVDRAVMAMPGNRAPRYPELLRSAGVEGRVMVRFVVDTTGRVERGSVTVVESHHDEFAKSVIEALRQARFEPAELEGRRVRQLVEQPFEFRLTRP